MFITPVTPIKNLAMSPITPINQFTPSKPLGAAGQSQPNAAGQLQLGGARQVQPNATGQLQIGGARQIQPNAAGQLQPNAQARGADMPFKEIFGTAIQNLRETEITSNQNSTLLALGDVDDLHTIGIDATKAFLAERLVIELRNRAMEAYSEIMRINL